MEVSAGAGIVCGFMGGCRGGGGRKLGDWRERGDTDAGELADGAEVASWDRTTEMEGG
jgi:hypothetical protein